MAFVQIVWFYILWHYTKAWQDIFRIIGNYLWFVSNYFSLDILLKTLFSPWRRLSVTGGKGMRDTYLGALMINTFMRGVGFLIRSATIFAGSVAMFFSMIFSVAVVLIWIILPVAVFFLFFAGLGQILKSLI